MPRETTKGKTHDAKKEIKRQRGDRPKKGIKNEMNRSAPSTNMSDYHPSPRFASPDIISLAWLKKIDIWHVFDDVYERNRDSCSGDLEHREAMLVSLLACVEELLLGTPGSSFTRGARKEYAAEKIANLDERIHKFLEMFNSTNVDV